MKQPKVYIKYLGKVLEVESINFDTKVVVVYDESCNIYRHFSFEDVDFICSTGFKDKNGKEIEHGDILKTDFEKLFSVNFHNFYDFYLVDEDNERLYPDETQDEIKETLSKTEVIGNIYKNKDLLEN